MYLVILNNIWRKLFIKFIKIFIFAKYGESFEYLYFKFLKINLIFNLETWFG